MGSEDETITSLVGTTLHPLLVCPMFRTLRPREPGKLPTNEVVHVSYHSGVLLHGSNVGI